MLFVWSGLDATAQLAFSAPQSARTQKKPQVNRKKAPARARVKRAPSPKGRVKTPIQRKRIPAAPARGRISFGAKPLPKPLTSVTFVSKTRATVFQGGLFVGVTNQAVSLSPGTHHLLLAAPGYPDVKKVVSLKRGQQLKINVTFVKPKPKPTPKPPPPKPPVMASKPARPQPKAAPQAKSIFSQPSKQSPKNLNAPKSGGGLSYDSALPMGSETIAAQSAARSQAPLSLTQPQARSPIPQAPQYQLSQPAPQSYGQPQYAQPYMMPQQQPYYVQPQYPQPYMMPQPYYQAPPPVYAPPPPVYIAPQPQYVQPMYAPEAISPVPLSGGRSSVAPATTRRATSRSSPKRSAFLALLPFGIGQFQNEHHIKGTFFAASEAGCLIGAVVIMYQTRPYQEKLASGDKSYDLDSITQYIKKQKDTQMYLYAAAGGLWLVGVIDAFININDYPKSNAFEDTSSSAEKRYVYSYGLGIEEETGNPGFQLNLRF